MKSLKHEYDKHLLITLIVLVALPLLLGFSNLVTDIYSNKIISYFILNFNDAYFGVQILNSLHLFQYIVFAVMLILYPIYPFIFSLEKHFSKRNPRSAITEYEILKDIIYGLFPFFIFAVALIIASRITQENPVTDLINSLGDPILTSLFSTTIGVIFFVVGSALLRIILLNRNKHFGFYLAKMSFRAISKVRDDVERIRYLIKGLNSYNKYIRRNLGLQINDIKTIYSKIVSDLNIDKSQSMKELSIAFEDNDRLKTIRCLTGLFKVNDTEHFLVKEPIGKKLEDWAGILGTLASTIAAILGALATLKIPGLS